MCDANPVIQAAKEYDANSASYKSMKQLGAVLGVSSHVVGRKLKEVELRTPDGTPTQQARDDGYVKTVQMLEGFYFEVWHDEKTLALLRPLVEPKIEAG